MSGKRNVSVCRGHELANALYMCNDFDHSTYLFLEELFFFSGISEATNLNNGLKV